jgi:hypothetical protein
LILPDLTMAQCYIIKELELLKTKNKAFQCQNQEEPKYGGPVSKT